MRIPPQQLPTHLKGTLAPVYLIAGDEPFQRDEAAQQVRAAARRAGFQERAILSVETGFSWADFHQATQALGLFSRRKRIELRLASGKIGGEGSAALCDYCAHPPEDILLLVLAHLEARELKAKWVQCLEKTGVLVPVRPLQGREFQAWIQDRLHRCGLVPTAGVVPLLADALEGNLPAIAQEIDRLALVRGAGPLDEEGVLEGLTQQARFRLFDLLPAALQGNRARTQRILQGLAAEGTAPALVLWALARELRLLAQAAWLAQRDPRALEAFWTQAGVWSSRRGPLTAALKHRTPSFFQGLLVQCARVDRQIKGLAPGDPWLSFAWIADRLAGGESLQQPSETLGEEPYV